VGDPAAPVLPDDGLDARLVEAGVIATVMSWLGLRLATP